MVASSGLDNGRQADVHTSPSGDSEAHLEVQVHIQALTEGWNLHKKIAFPG